MAYVGSRATDLGSVGLTSLGVGVNGLQGIVAEALGTFLLVFTIMAVAVDERAPAGWAGFLIGLAVATEIMLIGPFTGGSVNPARSFGPYLVNQLFGGSTPWSEFYVYIVGPLVGGVAGALCYEVLVRPGAAVVGGAPVEAGPPAAAIPGATSEEQAPSPEVPAQSRREAPSRSETKDLEPSSPPPTRPNDSFLRREQSPCQATRQSSSRARDRRSRDHRIPAFELKDGPGVNPANVGRKLPHGAILKVVATNICGSDQHMVRGRTTAPEGLILGHEITGEVVETGPRRGVHQDGRPVSVPFNIACGRCRNCKEGKTGVCLNVNPDRPGAAYGYVDMGGWVGGQAEYVLVPYADWNLLKFPDRDQAMEKIRDLAMLSDIFPTGYHGAFTAGVQPGRPCTSPARARSASRPPRRRSCSARPS